MNFVMFLQLMKERKGLPTDITVILGVLFAVNHLHVFVDVRRTEFLVAQLALLRLGVRAEVSLDVILEILNFVDSPITERTLEPGDLVVYEGVLPVPVDALTGLAAHRTPAQDCVPLVVGLGDDEVRLAVPHVVGHKAGDGVELDATVLDVTLPAPAVVVLHVTHHVAVVTEALVAALTLKGFL